MATTGKYAPTPLTMRRAEMYASYREGGSDHEEAIIETVSKLGGTFTKVERLLKRVDDAGLMPEWEEPDEPLTEEGEADPPPPPCTCDDRDINPSDPDDWRSHEDDCPYFIVMSTIPGNESVEMVGDGEPVWTVEDQMVMQAIMSSFIIQAISLKSGIPEDEVVESINLFAKDLKINQRRR